jgi:hypothetical protein
MASIKAIFSGRFFNRPKSIEAGAGITFTDSSDKQYSIAVTRWGRTAKSIAGGAGTTALTAAEAACPVLELSGVITGNRIVTIPAFVDGAIWHVFNNTTGSFSVTMKGPSGTGVVITQAKRVTIYSTDTDLYAATAEV